MLTNRPPCECKWNLIWCLTQNFLTLGSQLGNQLILCHRNREAMKAFRTAMKLDETSVPALTG